MAFCCHYCAYTAADLAGSMRLQYPPNVRIVQAAVHGQGGRQHAAAGFEERGRRGDTWPAARRATAISSKAICGPQARVAYAKKLLAEIGLEPERLEMFHIAASAGARCSPQTRERDDRADSTAGTEPAAETADAKRAASWLSRRTNPASAGSELGH